MLLKFSGFLGGGYFSKTGELIYSNGYKYEIKIFYELDTEISMCYSKFELRTYDRRKGERIFYLYLPFKVSFKARDKFDISKICVLF
jgi:hypothetical protein